MNGLTLLEPRGLLLLAGALPIIAFYILKTRSTRVRVGSTWLWAESQRALLAKHPFRKLLPEIPLVLQLLALAALAFALARPAFRGRIIEGEHVAIVVDTSASMAATTPSGTRMLTAQKASNDLIDALSPGADAMVVDAAREPRIVTSAERDPRRLHEAIAGLRAREVEGDLAVAVAFAADRLRAAGGRTRLFVVTDGALAHTGPLAAAGVPTEVLTVDSAASDSNAAIVRVDVRAGLSPIARHEEVFALVRSFDSRPRDAFVTATIDGASEPIAARRVLLAPDAKTAVVLTFEPRVEDRGKGLTIALSPGDSLAFDDVAYGRVPSPLKMPVTLASTRTTSWLARALMSDPEVDLQRLTLEQLATVNVDPDALVVVEGACPDALPGRDALLVAPPTGMCRGVEVAAPVATANVTTITSWENGDPRLRFLTLDGLHLREATPLRSSGAGAPLVRAAEATLIADASTDGRAATIVGFDVGDSDWPLKASFVLFVRNVVELARLHRSQGPAAGSARTGEPLRIAVPHNVERVIVSGPEMVDREIMAKAGVVVLADMPRAGIFDVRWTSPRIGHAVIPVNLTSERESDIRPRPLAVDTDRVSGAPAHATPEFRSHRNAAPWALGIAALAIAIDTLFLSRKRARAHTSKLPSRPRAERRIVLALVIAASVLPLAYAALVAAGVVHDTRIRFYRPWPLIAVAVASPLFAIRLERLAMSRVRRGLVTFLAATSLLAALVALADPEIGAPLERLTTILAVDRSRSIDLVPNSEVRTASELRLAEASMRHDDKLGVVVFGAEATTEDPPRPRSNLPPSQRGVVGRDGSDLEAALRRALSELPSDSAGRVVLITDGVQTRGDVLAAAGVAIAANVPVDAVLLDQKATANVRVIAVRSATHVDEHEALDLRVTTHSASSADVVVRVRLDGEALHEARAHIDAGEDVIRLREIANRPGLHRYDVEVSAVDPSAESSPDDNTGATFVHVRGPSLALVLEGDVGKAGPLVRALTASGFLTDERSATGVPADVSGLAGYDLVVLSDIAASVLAPSQIEALASYTRDLGGGLLLFGGDRSMGPGGYARTPLEEVSPVRFDLKEQKRRASLAEILAIDYSGSMSAEVGGQTKLALANEAAARSATLLGPGDRLGVEHVDDRVAWTLPIAPVTDASALATRIRSVAVGGGGIYTDIALKAAYGALLRETVNLRHVLLFADGDDAEQLAGCRTQVTSALRQGITTSVISLGRGHDSPELEVLSKLGNGRFYLIDDATRLPAVFSQETILATKSALHEDPFRVALGSPGPGTRGIDFAAAPQLGGYVVTVPKPRASVLLTGPEGDPILASWAVGLGHSAAFMSDAKDRWGAAWLAWEGASRLFGQLARETARKAFDPRVRLASDTSGGELHVRADVIGDDGRAQTFRRLSVHIAGPDGFGRDVALEATGAGRYTAAIPLSRPGAYVATAKDDLTGDAVATTGAVLTAGEELRPTGSDRALLQRVTTMTGGRMRDTLAGLFDDRVGLRFAYTPIHAPLVLASAIALIAGVGARRIETPHVVHRAFGRVRARLRTRRQRSHPRHADHDNPSEQAALGEPLASSPTNPIATSPAPPTADKNATPAAPTSSSTTVFSAAELLARRRREKR
jgi:Ca-activated chloride channel homolog